jgi:ABC-type amino acid transport substrate-binding protein
MLRNASLFLVLLAAAGLAQAQALDGRLKKIADTRTIALAYRTDAAPFSFEDDKKQPIGYTVDLCKRLATLIQNQIGAKDLAVKWVPVTSQNRFDVVAKGQADLECGASTATLSRMKQVDFSSFVFVDGTGLMTLKATGIGSLADLGGKRIGVVSGTTNERAVERLEKRRTLGLKVTAFKSRDEAWAALEEGKVDAFAGDKLLLLGGSLKAKDPKALHLLPEDLSFEPYAIALPRNDAGLRHAVNTGLAHIYREGEIVSIFNKWFGAFGEPTGLLRALFVFGSLPE